MAQSTYILPCSPLVRCDDRFSISSEDEGDVCTVSFWSVVETLLKQHALPSSPDQIIDVVETLNTTRLGNSGEAGDFASLKPFIARNSFPSRIWPKLTAIALDLPKYFPHGELRVLEPDVPLNLSRGAVASLVVHQFLCTLRAPSNRDTCYDFSIWYGSDQPHPRAVDMYLEALFAYFESLPSSERLLENSQSGNGTLAVEYVLHRARLEPVRAAPLTTVEVIHAREYTSSSIEFKTQGADGAAVVSANKIIGFGKSATQEEIFVGITPEGCPAVLVATTLVDDTALVISGARSTLHAMGQRREVHWTPLALPNGEESFADWVQEWKGVTMLFMDALELDEVERKDDEGLADLLSQNIEREVQKAYIAFSARRFQTIFSGPWGCGAFGGNAAVKIIVLWIAASLAGVAGLKITLDPPHHDLGARLRDLVRSASALSAEQLLNLLLGVPKHMRNLEIMDWILENVEAGGA